MGLSFRSLVVVSAIAFAAPLLLGLFPRIPIPSTVLELGGGIVVGPSLLGWGRNDRVIGVLALLGLAFLLFLGGLEIDVERLRGRMLKVAAVAFGLSLLIALAVGYVLGAVGLVKDPLLIAVILASTSLGVVIPLLKDIGESRSAFGQLVIAAASIADFGTIVLAALLFSKDATGTGSRALVLVGYFVLAGLIALAVARGGRSGRIAAALARLQDTTAQIRVRGAFLLLVAFVAVAQSFGVEAILGAFLAGAIVAVVDRDPAMNHPLFRVKLEAIGFGVFVPIFFVASGMSFDLQALTSSSSAIMRVPVFLVALLVVRGLPAVLYRPLVGSLKAVAAGLLQATSLSFVVAAVEIWRRLGILLPATGSALIAAAVLSVLIYPAGALSILKRIGSEPEVMPETPA